MTRILWDSRSAVTPREVALEFRSMDTLIRDLRKRVAALETSAAISTGTGNVNIRRGTVAVSAGANTVTFSSSMGSTNYALSSLPVYVSSSETAQANLTGKSATGFTCYSPSAGTLDYTAVEIA